MKAAGLRQWRGVNQVASPSGVTITTRLRTTPTDDNVLNLVADHLGRLRRADLAVRTRPETLGSALDGAAKHEVRRERLNNRKSALTAQSTSRWASAIIRANDDQLRLSREVKKRHIVGLQAAISVIEKRLVQPTRDCISADDFAARRKARLPKGYATQAERFQKQRRLQVLRARLDSANADMGDGVVHVTEGGKRLAKVRHNLDAANLSLPEWRERWDCARYRIAANGSGDEPFGNLTITVAPTGEVSMRLPRPLEHLANASRGRYVLSGRALFSHRSDEWQTRITGGQSISYSITRKEHRAGRYLTASWASPSTSVSGNAPEANRQIQSSGSVVGVDLNDGHLAVRRLDEHGNPVGHPVHMVVDLFGSAARRDAQVRHAVTRLVHYTRRHGVGAIAVEDLDFSIALATGRETMGRGRRGKNFRRAVTRIPTAIFRNRLAAQASRHGIRLYAVNPAYTSAWGDQHWRKPYENVTRHQAAATVIGRRAQGFRARRREGVTRARPEDRAVRATNQAEPESQQVIMSRHRLGTRGTTSRSPSRARTRQLSRATVTPASATDGQLRL